ncbi:Bug family tripartite tricarboxylate transporter substrate binding protein [Falsiroseomonas oryzae]|uniref:Bug family tripartite tricarboxylate transporter substrate binding protein n=1 Tax=Falsiroseomonas oryzae TaxID=2766473 RepID=UPI0022EB6BDA|nr:tripartite tricarboxylate transporter substrate binding protein [Roseomonas sp. MO-31]
MTPSRRSMPALIAAALAVPRLARAQAWPTRPVRLVVPFPPGGPTDIMGRLLATQLEADLRQPFVVENRAGATGAIGSQAVIQSPPDGYTLVVGTLGSHALQPLIARTPAYDPRRDFTPVSLFATIANVLMVHPSVAARSAGELVALLRAEPGRHNYGSAGVGSPIHLSAVLLEQVAQVQAVHVPYRGSAPALQDLQAGRLTFMFDAVPSAMGLIQSGAVRALAVTTPRRIAALPELPTMEEAGIRPYDAYTWNAIFGPPRLPEPIVARLNEAVAGIVARPEFRTRAAGLGADAMASTPEALRALVVAEMEKWRPIVAAAGAQEG